MDDKHQNAYSRLTGLKQQAENAQGEMKNFRSDAGAFLADSALKHFHGLNEMDADDIRKFGQIISETTRTLSEDLNKLQYRVRKAGE